MVVAGEASGDLHAAKLVNALRESLPPDSVSFFGSAGERMREAGVEAVIRADGLSIVGLPEIARALPMFVRAFRSLSRAAMERQPDVVILVDFPDFNLKMARTLSRRGFRIVYYISPQLWAWRRYRLRTIRKYVDLVISILPFEKGWYEAHGLKNVEYVGSPLAREVFPSEDKSAFTSRNQLDPTKPIISLLPGSRHKEIVKILPVMLEAAVAMLRSDTNLQFVIATGSEKNRADANAVLGSMAHLDSALKGRLLVVQGETFNAVSASDATAVASGTATLETGILGTPMAIVYKTSTLNYKLLRPLINVEHFGLINLIAGDRVATELIQDDLTPETLANELLRLLEPSENKRVREKLRAAADKLGHGGASARAASLILAIIERDNELK